MNRDNVSFVTIMQENKQNKVFLSSTRVISSDKVNDTVFSLDKDESSEEYYEMLSEMRLA